MMRLDYAVRAALDHICVTYYQLPCRPNEDGEMYLARIAAALTLAAVGPLGPWYEAQASMIAGVSSAYAVGAARPDEAAGTATPSLFD